MLLIIATGLTALAQSSTPTISSRPLDFDAATVRVVDGAIPRPSAIQTLPNSLTIRNTSLRDCIQWAYDTPATQVSGPGWLSEVHLDINAKMEEQVTINELRSLLKSLLATRLGVETHTELRQSPVFALVLGSNTPKFTQSKADGPPIFMRDSSGAQIATATSMSEFASFLSKALDRPVVDSTGLNGRYDLRLDIRPYMPAPGGDGAGGMDISTVMISALKAELGLTLQSRKDNVEMLVVDRAQRTPTEN